MPANIDEALHSAGGVNPCRALAMDKDLPGAALPAAGSCHQGPCDNLENRLFAVLQGEDKALFSGFQFQKKGVGEKLNSPFLCQLDIPPGIFRAGKLLTKAHQAKAVVNALLEYSPGTAFPLYQANPGPGLISGDSGG